MKYQVGKVGRVIVAKFEDKEDVLGNLSTIVKRRDSGCGVLSCWRYA